MSVKAGDITETRIENLRHALGLRIGDAFLTDPGNPPR